MANDVQKFFSGHQVPDRKSLSTALKGLSAVKSTLSGNKALLKFSKVGKWVLGMDNEEVKPGTRFIADPASLSWGFVAWWLAQVEDERMQPLSAGPVDPTTLPPVNSGGIPPGSKDKKPSGVGWQSQLSIEMVTQSDVPLAVLYKTSSRGGLTAIMDLAGAMDAGMQENPNRCYPVLEVAQDSYIHKNKEIGQVLIPIINIVGWLDADGKEVKDLKSLI